MEKSSKNILELLDEAGMDINRTQRVMRLAAICLVVIVSVAYVYAAEEPQYTDKYDNVDIDQIINNDRLLKRYVDCMLDKPNVRCPAEAAELKKHINEALETECEKCSQRHREMVEKVIKFLILNKQDMWNQLKAKYDPEGKYAKRYEDMAKEHGLEI